MTSTQPSRLLSSLFEDIEEHRRITVLHIGPALPETVDFFSRYRCTLHFIDLFGELPLVERPDGDPSLEQEFARLLHFPEGTRFDVCLFWDLFNYLSSEAVTAFITRLRPCLHPGSRAHGFTVHNLNTPQGDHLYGIRQQDQLSIRHRAPALPGYAPHNQQQLQRLLSCFSFIRSMLLPDSRLELLLHARLAD